MAIRKYKPTTPGRRGASGSDFAEITRSEPEKSLVRPLHSKGGRNVHGRVTARHQGGGHKRAYRLIDFRRHDKDGVPAKVAHIEYDPNRTARIALLHYVDGEKRYIIARRGCSRATGSRTARARTSSRATPCRCSPSRPARSSTRSSCAPVGARRSRGRRARASSCWPRKARTRLCVCRPARSAGCPSSAARPSARSATPSRATSTGQGGPYALEGQAPDRARRRDEPDRPPARRWRGQDLRWSPPGQPVGQARRPYPSRGQAQ